MYFRRLLEFFYKKKHFFMLQFEQAKMSFFRMSATMVNLAPETFEALGRIRNFWNQM